MVRGLLPFVAVAVLCTATACNADTVTLDGDGDTQTGTGTDTGDPTACVEPDWDTTQSYFWQLSKLWSDGERVIGHGSNRLLIHDGETLTWHTGVTPSTSLQELEARALDQVWLVGESSVDYWDGETTQTTITNQHAPDVEVAADGQAWLITHPCEADACGSQLWRWQDDETWLEVALPDLPPVRSFWAGPDGELWLGTEDSLFVHRSPTGEWTIENVEDEGYQGWSHPNGWQNFPTFTADSLDVDAEGNLWASHDFEERVSFVHRSPTGEWSFSGSALIIADAGNTSRSIVVANGDEALVFRRGAERALRRFWVPGYLTEVISSESLGIDAVTGIAGSSERLALLSFGPKVTALDPNADPYQPERLVDVVSVPPFRTSAPIVDAAVSAHSSSLVRFDGQQWTEILRVPDSETGSLIIDVFADAADSGWLIAGEDPKYGPDLGRRLWRWQDGQASPTPIWVQGDDRLDRLWGSAPDRIWMTGIFGGQASIWKYDGVEWGGAWQGDGWIVDIAGDADSVFFFHSTGAVFGWQGSEWVELGAAIPSAPVAVFDYLQGDTFARVGDELLLHVHAYYQATGDDDVLMRWDGQSWSPVDDQLPLQRLSNDAQGRAWAIGDGKVFRHDGLGPADQGWEELEVDHIDDETLITASTDGALVRGPWYTSVFRPTCED